ncbi:VOC family protein [Thalassospira xianhensis]|uniref:Glyoxalase n=1 Tax=Thalassospira xianhensis MCCC 1A02616 TaxID=1177929 RepID=A0A367UC59_9PROT|nr:VOC family protein [Thalassospira xianhensis]RCK04864.1 glyoxalase [Thalassospira xianhensis MCCC 1A02616]
MFLDHIEFAVTNADTSKRFYEAALAPLGIKCIISQNAMQTRSGAIHYGLGRDGYPRLWFHDGKPVNSPIHIGFSAPQRATVDAFHAAALAAGGRDNGAPGIRHNYHSNYYAAFILDPDGNNIECVCQTRDDEI